MRRIWRKWFMVALTAGALVLLGSGLALAQPVPPFGGWGGGGMMGGMGGMMGGMMGGWAEGSPGRGGYGGYGPGASPNAPRGTSGGLTIDQAIEAVKGYLSASGNPDLKLAEVMEFANNFYAEVEEQSTGIHALELIVDRYTGAVYPEMGPNMMWNTRYSPMINMMGGMMGWGWFGGWGNTTVSPEQAREIANQWLARYLPGTTAGEVDAFYGYYTLHTQRDDRITGMLSVNASTGQVWYHTWHGSFVQMKELE